MEDYLNASKEASTIEKGMRNRKEGIKMLKSHLAGMKYKRRNKSDGEIYDFMEMIVNGPVPREAMREFKNPDLVYRVRAFFVNNNYPFTVLDNGKEWYLTLRKPRNTSGV